MRMYSQTLTHTHCSRWDFFQRIRPQSYSFVMPSRCLVWGHRLWITSLNLQPNRFWSIYVVLCPSCPLQGSAKIGVNLRRFYLMDCFSYSLLVMSSGCGLWACRGWYVFMDAHGVAQCGSGPNLRVALSWGFDLSPVKWGKGFNVEVWCGWLYQLIVNDWVHWSLPLSHERLMGEGVAWTPNFFSLIIRERGNVGFLHWYHTCTY